VLRYANILRHSSREISMTEVELLTAIDDKLSGVLGLLAKGLPSDNREGVAIVLRRAGISTGEIAEMLGKSQRWVQASLKDAGFKE
jgi:hypothetical protein